MKGNRNAQRRRRRTRYRGCPICGVLGGCTSCTRGSELVAMHGHWNLVLVVDGSFSPRIGPRPGSNKIPGYGGAGLVLVLGTHPRGAVIAQVACGFDAFGSGDAEFQAVIRGARWAPGVTIYTDSNSIGPAVIELGLRVEYLPAKTDGRSPTRPPAHDLAHVLSVEGRCRDQKPDGGSAAAIAKARRRTGLSKQARRLLGVDILLEHAAKDPAFDGDFEALAERLGWTTSRWWRENPSIRIAARRWRAARGESEPDDPEPAHEISG